MPDQTDKETSTNEAAPARLSLLDAVKAYEGLVETIESLIHVAALDNEGDTVADAILKHVSENPPLSPSGSHDTSLLRPLAIALTERLLGDGRHVVLELGTDYVTDTPHVGTRTTFTEVHRG